MVATTTEKCDHCDCREPATWQLSFHSNTKETQVGRYCGVHRALVERAFSVYDVQPNRAIHQKSRAA